jgi:hypothetical protein
VRTLVAGFLLMLCACGGSSPDGCIAVSCGATPIAMTISLTDARGSALTADAQIANLVVPAGVTRSGTSCSTSAGRATCFVDVDRPGHYEFDIGAAGYAAQHIKVDLAPGPTGGCCAAPYLAVQLAVALSP